MGSAELANQQRFHDVVNQASADMIDLHLSVLFKAVQSKDKYLCIQDDILNGVVSSIDIATKKNLDDLVKEGEELLKKPVSRINLKTRRFESCGQGSNQEALKRFAKLLSEEK